MKLSRISLVVSILTGCFAFAVGCTARVVGSGNLASETRMVSGFHAVELAASGNLNITQGDKEELVVEAEDNILPFIETQVKSDGTLLLTFKSGESVETHKTITFKLSVKTLDKMVLTGSGNVHVGGKLTAENEAIKLPGSGNVALDDLQTGALTAIIEGSGSIKIADGGASSQDVRIPGSGRYEATSLKTDAAKVSVDGSGHCKLWAEKKLEASISGSGEIEYRGQPELRERISGSGAVRALKGKE